MKDIDILKYVRKHVKFSAIIFPGSLKLLRVGVKKYITHIIKSFNVFCLLNREENCWRKLRGST